MAMEDKASEMRFTLHRTCLRGFRAELMRWDDVTGEWQGRVGGILLRGFGFRFMAYKP